ncbi:hypothetical protein [Streptomyces lavendofoliae]|uniref:Uncharacterized protein n=1 Tax=Streptomyces lavendofoliae TaxID=67314 RepID=A0A918HVG0_9ACTN|nr:hypothetical protein [Streptomyces lavendofoliae]GGU27057.1 hypothetical protein GCM10010274_12040 [Streptomyces lavendofoliae]
MTVNDPMKLETSLGDGRRVTLSLPPTEAPWGAGGVGALKVVPATHTGRAQEPPPSPAPPVLPLEVALLGFGA